MEYIISNIIQKLIKYEIIKREEASIYEYGLFHFIGFLLSLSFMLIVGFVFECIDRLFCFLIFFIVVRKYAGGYHEKTLKECAVVSIIFLLITAIEIKAISYFHFMPIFLYVVFLFAVLLFVVCPIDNENKRLDDLEKVVYGRVFKIILLFVLSAFLYFYYRKKCICICIGLSIIQVSILVILEMMSRKSQ